MNNISLRWEIDQEGVSSGQLSAMLRTGGVVRLRRGAYAPELETEAVARHRQLLAAVVRQLSDDLVVSHISAALLHGLPTYWDLLGTVQFTSGRSGNGKTRADVRVRGLPLASSDVITLAGVPVTSLARTSLDLACELSLRRSVAIGDQALRLGMKIDDLRDLIEAGKGRHGIGRARIAVPLLDVRAESPGESESRVVFHLRGLPPPQLQYKVFGRDGRLLARCDMAWPELGTLGEFDGQTKYGALLRPGQTPEQVVFEEKLREDALRELGWEVVRWVWSDLNRPDALVRRIERAFERGGQRPAPLNFAPRM